jgi:phosphoglycolate phosphatase-like HAD superfamily hydrolase
VKVVLWDVDGTLLLNAARAGRLYDEAITAVTGVVPEDAAPNEHGMTDAGILTSRLQAYGLDAALLPQVTERLNALSEHAYSGEHARRQAPGVPAALAAVAGAGWTNGLLTGNSPTRVRAKFASAGLEPALFDWDRSWFGDATPVRADLVQRARAELGDTLAVIVGDTPADGVAADAAGLPFLAVATGAYDTDTLRGTSARLVIDDLVSGLPALLDALAGLAQRSSARR